MPTRRELLLGAVACMAPAPLLASDAALFERLRRGGHVLLMRHTTTEPGLGDPPGYRVGECHTQRNLSDAGRQEARRIGERLRAERVPISKVYTSPWCRCRDTAKLAFGDCEDWDWLASFFDAPDREAEASEHVRKRIGTYTSRAPSGNVAMVTHSLNIAALTKLSVATGEIVVVRPDGCCGLRTVERLRIT